MASLEQGKTPVFNRKTVVIAKNSTSSSSISGTIFGINNNPNYDADDDNDQGIHNKDSSVKRRLSNRRELIAWVVVIVQTIALLSQFGYNNDSIVVQKPSSIERSRTTGGGARENNNSLLRMNNHDNKYYEQRRLQYSRSNPDKNLQFSSIVGETYGPSSYYESPIIYPKEAGLVGRVWRSNGSPSINADLQQGSCWCSADEWCMCTPSLAVDVILTSGPDHLWFIRRKDTGKLALMGGFTEVGETSEESVRRELKEEMDIDLSPDNKPILFGIYNDPKRDARRHTSSVVYIVNLTEDDAGAKGEKNVIVPKAGDDATEVHRLTLTDAVKQNDFFIDHKTIINDYIKLRMRSNSNGSSIKNDKISLEIPQSGDGEPFKRSICPMP